MPDQFCTLIKVSFHQNRRRIIMKKYLLTTVLLSFFCFQTYCQYSPASITDSISLESAKRIAVSSKDSAEVEMMNEIALRTGYITSHERRIAISFHYATEALNEATRIDYKPGIAMALLILSKTSSDSTMNMPGNIATKESYSQKARQL